MKDLICLIPRILILFLTFLLPLKFGSTVGVPEMPMSYWSDPVAVLIAVWPSMLFPCFSALALAGTLLLPETGERKQNSTGAWIYGGVMILLCGLSLFGWRSASVWDFPAQNTAYLMGMSCYTIALIRICMFDKKFLYYLLWTLLASLVCSVYSAVNQYLTGFEETIRYIQKKEQQTGVRMLDGQFGNRLKESRVSGDFAICNVYGGYLIAIFPILLGVLWQIGSKVVQKRTARAILCVPVCIFFFFLLKETGSRGAILAGAGGFFLSVLLLPMKWKWRAALLGSIMLSFLGSIVLIRMWRSFNSMKIRFDYFQAAFKMMWNDLLTGSGWGEFMTDYLVLKDVVNDESPHSPHNFLLTFGSQCGLGAFLAAGLLLGIPAAAAGYVLYKRSRSTGVTSDQDPEADGTINFPAFGLCWGVLGWTMHSMIELNYETPGSFATAVVLCIAVFYQKEIRNLSSEKMFQIMRRPFCRVWIFLFCIALCAGTLFYTWSLIRAERNFDALHSRINIRFADAATSPPGMEEVRKLLENCDSRSPFPFAEVSAYCSSRGPYYIQEALFYLDKAIERSPARAAYHMRRYRFCSILYGKDSPAAQESLKKARSLSPRNPTYYPDGITPYGKRSY